MLVFVPRRRCAFVAVFICLSMCMSIARCVSGYIPCASQCGIVFAKGVRCGSVEDSQELLPPSARSSERRISYAQMCKYILQQDAWYRIADLRT